MFTPSGSNGIGNGDDLMLPERRVWIMLVRDWLALRCMQRSMPDFRAGQHHRFKLEPAATRSGDVIRRRRGEFVGMPANNYLLAVSQRISTGYGYRQLQRKSQCRDKSELWHSESLERSAGFAA